MKKLKCAIALLAALAFAVPFVGCNKGKGGGGGGSHITDPDVIRPRSLNLDTSGVKLLYDMDEDFTSEGLIVNVIMNNATQGNDFSETVELDDEHLTINSSLFKKGVAGTYPIIVTYELDNRDVSNTYSVTVQKSAGVYIEKTTTQYDFVLAGTEIDLSDITVKMATTVAGPKGEPLTSDKYIIKCFDSAQNEVALTDGKLIVTKSGTYQIWAIVENYTIPGTNEKGDFKAFVLVNAVDEIESITFDSQKSGTTTQPKSVIDLITADWKFTAKYKSGYEETVGKGSGLEIDINTNRTGKRDANVSYTSTNCIGVTKKVTTTVSYEITASTSQVETHEFSISELTATLTKDGNGKYADHNYFTAEKFASMTNNAFFTIVNSNSLVDYRGTNNGSDNNRLEVRYEVFEIDFDGVGTIVVGAASTSSTNTSAFYIVDEAGNYMSAIYTASASVFKDDINNIYAIKNKNEITFTFIITTPGKYKLCTADSYQYNGAEENTGRPLNLFSLVVTIEKNA